MAPRCPGFREEDRGYETPCRVWQGSLNHAGYGRSGAGMVHRREYERARGPIPHGLRIDHLCRVRACANPDHLEPVTHKENCRRGGAARADTKPGLSGWLQRSRIAAGLSQADLARVLGVTQGAVWGWESGRWAPSVSLTKLESALKVNLSGDR